MGRNILQSKLRLGIFLSGAFAVAWLSGCGGGTQGNNTATPPPPANPPQVTGIAPSSAQVGAPATTVLAYGSNFEQNVAIKWNGTALTTTCVDASSLISVQCATATAVTASIPASDLTSVGTAKVTVANPDGTSGPFTFSIDKATVGDTWVWAVPGITVPKDIVSDAFNGILYVSVASTDQTSPDSILAIDPVSGTVIQTIQTGNDPDLLSISSDGSYLWAGMDGSNSVQRFLLPGLTKDISFAVPKDPSGNPQQAVSLEAAPVDPHTLALVAGNWSYDPGGEGVFIFDDATELPDAVLHAINGGPQIDWIQWAGNDSTIYGNAYTGGFAGITTLSVNSSGVSLVSNKGITLDPESTQFEPGNGLLYSYGGAYDPVQPSLAGSFNLPQTGAEACTADTSINRYYCVTTFSLANTDVTAVELWVFNLNTYALISRTRFGTASPNNYASSITGMPMRLVRWGNAGLALITHSANLYGNGGIFLIDGAAVNPNATPDSTGGKSSSDYAWLNSISPQSAASTSGSVNATIQGTGFAPDSTACANCSSLQLTLLPTTYVSPTELDVTIPAADISAGKPLEISVFNQAGNLFSSNALTFTVVPTSNNLQVTPLNICGLSMAWDSNTQLLYVGTADYDPAIPNSIVAIDPLKGTIVKSQNVAPDPIHLSEAADGSSLYAVFASSTNLAQISLPNLDTTESFPLNYPLGGPYYANDIKAAPQDPGKVAAALYFPGYLSPNEVGTVIYENGVLQPDYTSAGTFAGEADIDTLAWSDSDQLLTGASSAGTGPLFELPVSSTGDSLGSQLPASFSAAGAAIHSDFGTGLIYSDDGNVADPNTGQMMGTYNASGLLVPDSSLNRVFILGQTAAQANTNNYTIESFDEQKFTAVSSITLDNLSGSPFRMVRWGASGLAILTTGGTPGVYENGFGMLYIIQDAAFVSNNPPSSAVQTAKPLLVQRRWKPLSKRQIIKLAHQAIQKRN